MEKRDRLNMKRVLLIATVLLISVISTACINNFAVQELNVKAKEFMDNGDYASAVERLKSSTDLAPTSYEIWYNLAVAYTKLDDYINAVEAYNKVIELNPEFAEAYYSLAVCEENLIIDIKNGMIGLNASGQPEKVEVVADDLTDEEKAYIEDLTDKAIKNYEKFIEISDDEVKKQAAQQQIDEFNHKAELE